MGGGRGGVGAEGGVRGEVSHDVLARCGGRASVSARVGVGGRRVEGWGFRVQGSGWRVEVRGFRVQGSRTRQQGSFLQANPVPVPCAPYPESERKWFGSTQLDC